MPSHLGSLELPHTSPHFLEIRRAVRRHTDMHVVVGLSGGPDSVALLAGTLAEGREVEAICIDHGLQDASAEVAATAAETAARDSVPRLRFCVSTSRLPEVWRQTPGTPATPR